MSKIDMKVVETARAFNIAEGQLTNDTNEEWMILSEPMEAWTDVGELRRDVFEHTRLMAAMNAIMNDKSRSEVFLKQKLMKDISDSAVLRRVRMI